MNQFTKAQPVTLTLAIALGLGLPAKRFLNLSTGDCQRRKTQWQEI